MKKVVSITLLFLYIIVAILPINVRAETMGSMESGVTTETDNNLTVTYTKEIVETKKINRSIRVNRDKSEDNGDCGDPNNQSVEYTATITQKGKITYITAGNIITAGMGFPLDVYYETEISYDINITSVPKYHKAEESCTTTEDGEECSCEKVETSAVEYASETKIPNYDTRSKEFHTLDALFKNGEYTEGYMDYDKATEESTEESEELQYSSKNSSEKEIYNYLQEAIAKAVQERKIVLDDVGLCHTYDEYYGDLTLGDLYDKGIIGTLYINGIYVNPNSKIEIKKIGGNSDTNYNEWAIQPTLKYGINQYPISDPLMEELESEYYFRPDSSGYRWRCNEMYDVYEERMASEGKELPYQTIGTNCSDCDYGYTSSETSSSTPEFKNYTKLSPIEYGDTSSETARLIAEVDMQKYISQMNNTLNNRVKNGLKISFADSNDTDSNYNLQNNQQRYSSWDSCTNITYTETNGNELHYRGGTWPRNKGWSEGKKAYASCKLAVDNAYINRRTGDVIYSPNTNYDSNADYLSAGQVIFTPLDMHTGSFPVTIQASDLGLLPNYFNSGTWSSNDTLNIQVAQNYYNETKDLKGYDGFAFYYRPIALSTKSSGVYSIDPFPSNNYIPANFVKWLYINGDIGNGTNSSAGLLNRNNQYQRNWQRLTQDYLNGKMSQSTAEYYTNLSRMFISTIQEHNASVSYLNESLRANGYSTFIERYRNYITRNDEPARLGEVKTDDWQVLTRE